MLKRCAILLGILGYVLVVWFYIVNPNGHTLSILSFVCPTCPIIETIGRTWPVYLLIFAPINAVMYAAIGFLLGKLLIILRSGGRARP